MSSTQRRVTQRAPQSCVYCSRRKLRCSKTIPCSNCVERGIQVRCHREAVTLSTHSLQQKSRHHSSPIETEGMKISQNIAVTGVSGSYPNAPAPAEEQMRCNFGAPRQSRPARAMESSRPDVLMNTQEPTDTVPVPVEGNEVSSMGPSDGDLAIEAAMSLESLAWGTTHVEHNKFLPSSTILALMEELKTVITTQKARDILHFHKTNVAWMHNVVYMPLFIKECEGYHTGRLQRDAAWLSLYCAVLCTGVYYMSEHQHQGIGFDNGFTLSKRLYYITIEAIMSSDFMVAQSVHSLQAISVILMCAHSLGDSRRMKVLLSCANTIAHNTSHRLHSQSSVIAKQLSFGERIEREVRKRIWCFLCTQDWYLIASKKSYSIFPSHGTSLIPANCREDFDDATETGDFQDLPLTVQTQSTYMIFLFKLTSQYRALFDQLSSIHAKDGSVADCFDAVLLADSRLEAIIGEIEQCLAEARPNGSQYVPAQRRALIIASWHQRVMIHRSFFCRSFQDRWYHYSRFICLAAARNIIRTYLGRALTQDATEIWSIPAHAISSCIIITLDSLFSTEKYTLEKTDVDLMYQALALLKDSPRPNSIVDRGVLIVEYLLNQGPQRRFKKLDPQEISQLARDIDTSASDGRQNESFNGEHNFSDGIIPHVDIFESVNNAFGDDELFMPYWYDSTTQGYNL
ncbi:hypothetical protein F4677DRAFT_458154 [Hypoxylon crocopeplum]|nr:hypothetical protein F4677DRAFT_458154 [Hypoxylon crocopeplum]